jgi:hypothetical protein
VSFHNSLAKFVAPEVVWAHTCYLCSVDMIQNEKLIYSHIQDASGLGSPMSIIFG